MCPPKPLSRPPPPVPRHRSDDPAACGCPAPIGQPRPCSPMRGPVGPGLWSPCPVRASGRAPDPVGVQDGAVAVVDDLEAEQDELETVLGTLTPAQWLSPSAAAGWTIADTV